MDCRFLKGWKINLSNCYQIADNGLEVLKGVKVINLWGCNWITETYLLGSSLKLWMNLIKKAGLNLGLFQNNLVATVRNQSVELFKCGTEVTDKSDWDAEIIKWKPILTPRIRPLNVQSISLRLERGSILSPTIKLISPL